MTWNKLFRWIIRSDSNFNNVFFEHKRTVNNISLFVQYKIKKQI